VKIDAANLVQNLSTTKSVDCTAVVHCTACQWPRSCTSSFSCRTVSDLLHPDVEYRRRGAQHQL